MSHHVSFDCMLPEVYQYDPFCRSQRINAKNNYPARYSQLDDEQELSVSSEILAPVSTPEKKRKSHKHSSKHTRSARRSSRRTSYISDLRSENGDAQSVGEMGNVEQRPQNRSLRTMSMTVPKKQDFERNTLLIQEVKMGKIVDAIRCDKARLEAQKEVVENLNEKWEQERLRMLNKWKNQSKMLRRTSKSERSLRRNTMTAIC